MQIGSSRSVLARRYPHCCGVRWWFVCPLVVNDRACQRRVGKLYLPGGGRYDGCRHCYDLTYTSSQESDKRVSQLLRGQLDEFPLHLDDLPLHRCMLLIKALDKQEKQLQRYVRKNARRHAK